VNQVLFRSQVSFRRLNGCVSEQHLDLLKLAASGTAKFGTRAPQIMGRDARNSGSFRVRLDHLPHDLFAQAFAGYGAGAIHRSEHVASDHAHRAGPGVDCYLHPGWHRGGSDPAVLANQVDDAPATITLLGREQK
jgi:hypothetical protein